MNLSVEKGLENVENFNICTVNSSMCKHRLLEKTRLVW